MPSPDPDNPRGYLEWEAVKLIRDDVSWLPRATGRAVKVVAPLLRELPDRHRYAIVFCQRDLKEVVASQAAMLIRAGRVEETAQDGSLRPLLEHEVSRAARWVARASHVRALFLDHAEVVRDPLDEEVQRHPSEEARNLLAPRLGAVRELLRNGDEPPLVHAHVRHDHIGAFDHLARLEDIRHLEEEYHFASLTSFGLASRQAS